MCFSPEASFVAAGVLAPAGVATLRQVRGRDALIVGALPLFFAAHQAVEGVVWLGLEGRVSDTLLHAAIRIYLLFAQVALPVLVPVGLLLFERDGRRRRRLLAPVLLGCVVSARLLWVTTTHPIDAHVHGHSIIYDSDVHFGYVVAAAYVAATCGSALLSGDAMLWRFGAANLAGLTLAAFFKYAAVTSVWCIYAALASGLIAVAVRRRAAHRNQRGPLEDQQPVPSQLDIEPRPGTLK
jgi:uncharacterized protein DUF6629